MSSTTLPPPPPAAATTSAGNGPAASNGLTSDAYRLAGNASYGKKDFDNALIMYTMAIEQGMLEEGVSGASGASGTLTSLSTHYSNRSLLHSTMSLYTLAIHDAKECIRLSNGSNIKGYFRLVKAYSGKMLFNEAVECLEEGVKVRELLLSGGGDEGGDKDRDKEHPRIREEINELNKLKSVVAKHKKVHDKKILSGEYNVVVTSVKTDGRKPQSREFEYTDELGTGNFTRIVKAVHRDTKEVFAVKVIEKKQVESLKRRHPNIHNEIAMEKAILNKLKHRGVVELYHTYSDYNAIYFLMEFCDGAEMWTTIMHGAKLTGCHESLSRYYMAELVEVLEYMHNNGVVHRDLKPENLMITNEGHLKVIDFGTAKDLLNTNLNGPEFVGTPEFMSPECVKSKKAGIETDLWSFGIVLWQMLLGTTPFKAPSPYLGFLKIKRGVITRHPALSDDAWDLISKLLVVRPDARIGAGGKHDDLRKHPYFNGLLTKNDDDDDDENINNGDNNNNDDSTTTTASATAPAQPYKPLHQRKPQRVPTLADLCLRVVGELAIDSSLDPDAAEPGSGSSTDMLRLAPRDRARVMHFLDRTEKLPEPRVLRRFFKTSLEAKFGRVRPMTRDFLGLTSEYENNFTDPIDFVHIGSTEHISLLTTIVKTINRKRPKFVVVTGHPNEEARKIIAKISETVSFVVADGKDFYSFYCGGCQGIVVCGDLILNPEKDPARSEEQSRFVSLELEQSRMCQHHTFVFTDVAAQLLPEAFTEKVAKSRVCAILGPSGVPGAEQDYEGEYVVGKGHKKEDKEDKKSDVMDLKEDGVYPQEEEDREGSDIDSDGYNMVDDDSRVKVVSRGFSSVVALDHERSWKIFALPVA
jgi:3-phosphoinositide dependent protein kinase-1